MNSETFSITRKIKGFLKLLFSLAAKVPSPSVLFNEKSNKDHDSWLHAILQPINYHLKFSIISNLTKWFQKEILCNMCLVSSVAFLLELNNFTKYAFFWSEPTYTTKHPGPTLIKLNWQTANQRSPINQIYYRTISYWSNNQCAHARQGDPTMIDSDRERGFNWKIGAEGAKDPHVIFWYDSTYPLSLFLYFSLFLSFSLMPTQERTISSAFSISQPSFIFFYYGFWAHCIRSLTVFVSAYIIIISHFELPTDCYALLVMFM